MRRSLRLDVLDLTKEPEGATLGLLAFEHLCVSKVHGLLLLRESIRPHVPSDQVQLAPRVIQIVRASL